MLKFLIPILINYVYCLETTTAPSVVEIFKLNNGPKFEKILRDDRSDLYSNKKTQTARNFLEKYNSDNPVLMLVDDTKETNVAAGKFLNTLYLVDPSTKNINFLLMKYNTTGATSVLETTQNNSKMFKKLLQKEAVYESAYLGPPKSNRTLVFFAVLNAAISLPSRSGIVIFLQRNAADEDLVQHALQSVKKKNIRVYVVWGGVYPSASGEERLLKEFCKFTGGDFLVDSDRNVSQQNHQLFLESNNNDLYASVILSKQNILGEQTLTFPIDSDVTGIHININPFVTSGSVTSPRGYTIDLMDEEEVARYGIGSFIFRDSGLHEVHLNTTTAPTLDVGIWRLKLNNARASYNVTVFVFTKLTADVYINRKVTTGPGIKQLMKLDIMGDITLISNISFVNEKGQPILDNFKYNVDKDWDRYVTENVKTDKKKELQIELDAVVPNQPFYAVINGKDSQGHEFKRLSYVKRTSSNEIFPQQPLTIELGLGSQLITRPGARSEIFFEVTNHGTRAVDIRFTCRDEKYILHSMSPYRKILSPEETATVRVTLATRYGTFRDHVTFSAIAGAESIEKHVIVDVGLDVVDHTEPDLTYKFTSDCTGLLPGKCADGTWTVEAFAKDTGSGLLEFSSNPKGIYFSNGFTSGTKEEVTGYYSESCCNPRVQLIAVDRLNNRYTRDVNAYYAFWSAGAIAAIVLGVLILIVLIALLIYYIRRKCMLRKASYQLPVYRGGKI